jgi:hypothetical protein
MTYRFGKVIGGFALAMLVVTFVSVGVAQLPTGTILGVVKDSSGAVVPGVTVTIRNSETNLTRTIVTGDDGAYRVPALPVGQYTVRTEKNGFNTETQTGLTLEVAQDFVVNATMQVGSSSQEVTVTGEAPVVDTSGSALGGTVNEEKVADLPLNGRNWTDLTLLQAGVAQHVETGGGSPTTTAGLFFSSNGASTRSNNFMLDGAPMVVFYGAVAASVTGSTLGVDGIREYKVETSNFSADYGLSSGSQTTIVTKSGTNTFHGDVFEYLRNSSLDASNFFDTPASSGGKRLPEFRRNNFGGAFGGPIRKDKTFFYAVFEDIQQDKGLTPVGNALAPACHAATANPCATASGGVVSPIIFPLLQFFPLPTDSTGTLYSYPFSSPISEQYGQMRVDQNFSDKDTAFVRYTIDHATTSNPANGGPSPVAVDNLRGSSQFLTFSENHIFSPLILNTARFSISRTEPGDRQTNPNYPCSASTPTPCPTSFIAGFPQLDIGGITVTGITGIPASVQVRINQTIYAWSDDLFYTRGRHAFKFGTLITRWKQYQDYYNGTRGSMSFTSVAGFLAGGLNYNTISVSAPGQGAQRDWISGTLGFYAQDDVRATSRLTLNLGLRYEVMVPSVYEANGNSAALRNNATDVLTTIGPPIRNPSLLNFSPRIGFAWDIFGTGKTALRGGSSILYDIDNLGGQLAEAGHGMPFGNTNSPNAGTTTSIKGNSKAPCAALPLTIPFSFPACALGNILIGPNYAMKQPYIWTVNLNVQQQLPFGTALQVAYVGTRGINVWNRDDENTCLPAGAVNGVQNWANPTNITCPLGRINPNWGSMEFAVTNSRSYYNALQVSATKRMTRGFEFQASYTWSKNIDLGNAILGSDSFVADQTQASIDPFNPILDRGPAAFDITHNFHFNAIYHLPKTSATGFLGGLENGWWMSTIIADQTGIPFSPIMSTNVSLNGVLVSEGDRPNVNPGRTTANIISGTSAGCGQVAPGVVVNGPGVYQGASGTEYIAPGTPLGTPNLWYDPCAFSVQNAGFLGSESRNFLRGPSLFNLDYSIVKDTPFRYLGEAGQVEFRAEFFNILNHPNFNLPNPTIFSGAFNAATGVATAVGADPANGAGQITSTLRNQSSRQVQLALRVSF